jgi:hypothetical protein
MSCCQTAAERYRQTRGLGEDGCEAHRQQTDPVLCDAGARTYRGRAYPRTARATWARRLRLRPRQQGTVGRWPGESGAHAPSSAHSHGGDRHCGRPDTDGDRRPLGSSVRRLQRRCGRSLPAPSLASGRSARRHLRAPALPALRRLCRLDSLSGGPGDHIRSTARNDRTRVDPWPRVRRRTRADSPSPGYLQRRAGGGPGGLASLEREGWLRLRGRARSRCSSRKTPRCRGVCRR